MNNPIVEFVADEPRESIDQALVSLLTASQLLGDAKKGDIHPLTLEQLTDILDLVDRSIEMIRNMGI